MPRARPIACLCWTIAACAAHDAGPEERTDAVRMAAEARDSAGTTIVQSEAPWWSEGEAWTIVSEPELRIGSVDAADGSAFERVSGAVTLGDGRIVVADAAGPRLSVFDHAGVWLRTAGRRGAGPGEFEAISLMQRISGDWIFIFDWSPTATRCSRRTSSLCASCRRE